jgi:hypothetical protein
MSLSKIFFVKYKLCIFLNYFNGLSHIYYLAGIISTIKYGGTSFVIFASTAKIAIYYSVFF